MARVYKQGGCRKFDPVFGGDGMKKSPSEDIFDQPRGGMN